LVQPLGTARIGKMFGPIMLLWFLTIGLLGLWGVVLHPGVIRALNPLWGVDYLVHGGRTGFLVLGGVFLCVTGAEALYADMGHVGARPIRLAWYGLVLPALVLNYAGQAGIVLDGKAGDGNIFFMLCPPAGLLALILLSTVATIIASQSIITGAFSMTRQAIQLGWCPRLKITQTSAEGYGQIYVGTINWMMMVLTIALALGFRKSDNLAAAYGIAVSLTMLLTSCLLFVAMREIWNWRLPAALAVAGSFAFIDAGFVAANSLKILEGGWIPLALAAMVYGLMLTWHRGVEGIMASLPAKQVPVVQFLGDITAAGVARVPGTAVFLTRTLTDTPPMMVWHVKNNRALHRVLVALSVQVLPVPWVEDAKRVDVELVAENFWRLTATYGFMEQPDLPAVIAAAHRVGCNLNLDDVIYYVGHETVVHRTDGQGMVWWREAIFSFMMRNSAQAVEFFRLPREGVVEIGRQIEV